MRFKDRIRLKWPVVLLVSVLHTICGVFSVKAFAFLETGFNSESLGNLSLFGGVFFMPVLYYLGAKISGRRIQEVFDLFTICMIFTVMCARINCIISGCCAGLPILGMQLRYPTRELEILYYLVMLILFIPRVQKDSLYGCGYPIYMASYGGFRFIIEFFRVSSSETLFHLAHVWAALAFAAGFCVYIEVKSKLTNQVRKKGKRK